MHRRGRGIETRCAEAVTVFLTLVRCDGFAHISSISGGGRFANTYAGENDSPRWGNRGPGPELVRDIEIEDTYNVGMLQMGHRLCFTQGALYVLWLSPIKKFFRVI